MNINDVTFGIEIECFIPSSLVRDGTIRVGGHHAGFAVAAFPAGWKCERDGSVNSTDRAFVGVEFVSPKLKGVEGIRQIQAVAAKLAEWGAHVDASCGFHVHIGFARSDMKSLRKLVHLVASYEKALFATTGTKARENNGFCQPIHHRFKGLALQSDNVAGLGYVAENRYHSLNLSNLIQNKKPTVEFRAFAGTVDGELMIAHALTCLALVERAMTDNRIINWEPQQIVPTSPAFRKGEGQTQCARLFYGIGWTKGNANRVYGNIQADGLPTIKQLKRRLVQNAKQYDAQ